MLGFLGSAISAILGGGATGLLGSAITAFSEYKKQKLMFAHDIQMHKLDTEAMNQEWEHRTKIAEVETEGRKDVAESEVMEASYSADKAMYATGGKARNSKWFIAVDFIRGCMRPLLTLWGAAIMSYVTIIVIGFVGGLGALPIATMLALFETIISGVLYVGTTCILWWFGTRNKIFGPK